MNTKLYDDRSGFFSIDLSIAFLNDCCFLA